MYYRTGMVRFGDLSNKTQKIMRRIIDGLRYDTETATKVASYWNGVNCNDFRYVHEELYFTKKANWFLMYDGGAMSEYSESSADGWQSGATGITPLLPDQAYKWLERHGKTKALETYFSDSIEEA